MPRIARPYWHGHRILHKIDMMVSMTILIDGPCNEIFIALCLFMPRILRYGGPAPSAVANSTNQGVSVRNPA